MKAFLLMIAVCAALAIAGCGGGDDSGSATAADSGKPEPKVTIPNTPPPKTLEIRDLEVGTGAEAKSGDKVTVKYASYEWSNGEPFYSSWDKGKEKPYTFRIGDDFVIDGWEQGMEGMKEGGRRELVIPPKLAYGNEGAPTIPAGETLVFVIDLLEVK